MATTILIPAKPLPSTRARWKDMLSAPPTALPIVVVAFLLRLVCVCFTYKGLAASHQFEDFGAEMGWTARSLALGHGFSSPFFPSTGPTALVCPLFPMLLAFIFKLFGTYSQASAFVALALNSAFSSLTSAVIFYGMRGHFGRGTARSAAWLWAVYPYAIYYSAVYLWDCALTSLLFACCFFWAVTSLARMRLPAWAAYGVLVGLAALSNPSILTLVPVLLLWALRQRYNLGRETMRPLALTLVALLATLAPWCIRNVRTMHSPVLMRDGFWAEFYAGNSGDTSHSNPGWTHPASNPADMLQYQQRGETGYMAWKHALSIQRVQQHPVAFVITCARRVVRFWTGYWSFSRSYLHDEALDLPNVPFCSALTLLLLIGVWQLYRRERTLAVPYLAVFAIFPLPYYITHASMDYRQAIEPMIVGIIACGGTCLTGCLRRRIG